MTYFEYKSWVHMYVRESTARSLFYIQRHVPRIDGTEFKFSCVRTIEKTFTFVLEKAQENFEVCLCDLVHQRQLQIEVKVCTKYSAYFETSKGNNDILRVQILGTHVRA